MPERISIDQIDARWNELQSRNPRYFDGPCWHVLGVSRNGHGGAAIHVIESSYRFYAVQDEAFDAGFRGLGVRGIVRSPRGVLLGRRAAHVAWYPGQWEFVPAGKLEPGVDPAAMIARELAEEASLAADAPVPVAIVFDPVARTWQIVFRCDITLGPPVRASDEHDELVWCPVRADRLPLPLAPVDRQLASLL